MQVTIIKFYRLHALTGVLIMPTSSSLPIHLAITADWKSSKQGTLSFRLECGQDDSSWYISDALPLNSLSSAEPTFHETLSAVRDAITETIDCLERIPEQVEWRKNHEDILI